MMRRLVWGLALGLVMAGWLGAPIGAAAQQAPAGAWLDRSPITSWNTAGAAIPPAPTPAGDPATIARCASARRTPADADDQAVAAAGWTLYGPVQRGGQVAVILGMAAVDGMCRPWQYQAFVFIGGRFAGVLAPTPMNSRTDGALDTVQIFGEGSRLEARYRRYADKDPLCCPSSARLLTFTLDAAAPLVTPASLAMFAPASPAMPNAGLGGPDTSTETAAVPSAAALLAALGLLGLAAARRLRRV